MRVIWDQLDRFVDVWVCVVYAADVVEDVAVVVVVVKVLLLLLLLMSLLTLSLL